MYVGILTERERKRERKKEREREREQHSNGGGGRGGEEETREVKLAHLARGSDQRHGAAPTQTSPTHSTRRGSTGPAHVASYSAHRHGASQANSQD